MKILVTTPGGRIGQVVLGELLAPEFSVRVIAREPSRLPEEVREQVQLVRGSTDDPRIMRSALEGIESLFWCVPRPSLAETDLHGYYERFSRAACQALRAAGTPRVVAISPDVQEPGLNTGPTSLQYVTEGILDKSGAAIRHLRYDMSREHFRWQGRPIPERGPAFYSIPRNGQIPRVAVRDIADLALRWLVRRDWKGIAAVPVHGAENFAYQVQGMSD